MQIHRQVFAANAASFFDCDSESENGAVNFRARCFDRLARFQANAAGKFFVPLSDTLCDFPQNPLPLKGGHASRDLERMDSRNNGPLDMRTRRHRNRADYALVVRRANFRDRAATDPLTIEEEPFSDCGSGDDAGHMLTASGQFRCYHLRRCGEQAAPFLSAASKAVSDGSAIIFLCLPKFLLTSGRVAQLAEQLTLNQ